MEQRVLLLLRLLSLFSPAIAVVSVLLLRLS